MVKSNAYIATDSEKLMKVGKSNNIKRRQKQIELPVVVTIACLNEVTALKVENQLRLFVIEKGGIQHQNTIDWFKFDAQIYAMLCEFSGKLEGFEPFPIREKGLEEEIAELRSRYYQLLIDEQHNLITKANVEIERLKPSERETIELNAVLRKTESDLEKTKAEIRELYREIAQLEARGNSSKE